MDSILNTYSGTIQALINPHLEGIKRQRMQHSIIKACRYGIPASAILVALYIIFWPDAVAKLSALGQTLLNKQTVEILFTLVPALMLWLVLSITLFVIYFLYLLYRRKASPTYSELLHHLNREYPALEESAHLALFAPSDLSVLQSMQLQRVLPSLLNILGSSEPILQLTSNRQKTFIRLLFTILASAVLVIGVISANHQEYSSESPVNVNVPKQKVVANYLPQLIVSVNAPSYTQQPSFSQSELDINVLQGSVIEWLIPLDDNEGVDNNEGVNNNAEFELTLSNGDVLPFARIERGYSLTYVANAAAVYSIMQFTPSANFSTDIATLSVKMDAKPVIKIKQPLLTITELAKNSVPVLNTEVEISDDYGLSNVKIVASIAKGSGESVKFRDQTFSFDSSSQDSSSEDSESQVDDKNSYVKRWDLAALDMSPGDELYFSIHASDNKTPESQTSISPTRIVRWLEDEQQGITSDGVVIDFIPEYFKSQRQIIIETEALIEQQDSMSTEVFKRTSRALAIDQSDLKQSYGQYLGDEFESGVMHTMEAGPAVPSADEHDHSDEDEGAGNEESNHDSEHSHESDSSGGGNDQAIDLSGYQQVIEQYGHNHGEVDIGFIKTSEGQINPKVLMKRAVAEMWQAELHLQLSSPALALPYEKEALNYLNRAKQAERIYVKRLGFEPPPVSEERRYQGKLKDILSYQRSTQASLPANLNTKVLAFMAAVNHAVTLQHDLQHDNLQKKLSPSERQTVDDMAQLLTDRLNQSPEWVEQLATIKRIQMANSFALDNCEACLPNLMVDLNTLLSTQIAPPLLRQSALSTQNAASKAYSEMLLQLSPAPSQEPNR
ncbi:hypothetical protein [Brumicola nitratireducens]|uniref:DUF4175 domain-containing protein n=1 Tax=Glaciecola nitratireducens (strain JCM 12485 / KCTC 12276 / FR1064) TaxID=1085623 RepID=G4QDT2_GLANF|nr:hypothetical protein [Glaciecola nitratireducens]AEP31111.1 hypothetical protein GNIT_3015 [Glaciecola nitratireducens FR1064]